MDKSSKLDDARALQQFTQNADEMEKWLKEKLLQISSDESFKDPTNIQRQLQKHQAFEAELAANADRLQSLLATGQNLMDQRQYEGLEQAVKARLESLILQWETLVARAAQKSKKLKEASKQQTYNTGVKDLPGEVVVKMETGEEPSGACVEASGSEDVSELGCNLCSDEQTKEAVGYCVDCEERLCKECFRAHKKSKASRHHVVINVLMSVAEEMNNSNNQGCTSVDKCTEKCDSHDDKRIKYYCENHDFLACSKCVIDSHRACEIQDISEKSTGPAAKEEFHQTTADLEDIAKQSNELLTDLRTKKVLVKQNKKENIEAFSTYKKKLVRSLDEMENSFKDECSKNEMKEIEMLENIEEKCKKLEKASLQTKGQLEVYEDKGQHCNMFVAVKRGKRTLKTLRDSTRGAQDSSSITLYTFKPNRETEETLKSLEGIGTSVAKGKFGNYVKSITQGQLPVRFLAHRTEISKTRRGPRKPLRRILRQELRRQSRQQRPHLVKASQ